jgi:electron transfer flavoprotein-quinone oxidoreductase
MAEKFDVVVVGAGPAGITAALALARVGMHVVVFERAQEPGQKNMFGGVLHNVQALENLVSDFWLQAPLERYVTQYLTTVLTSDASMSFTFDHAQFAEPPYNGFTLLRAKFDRWYALKAQEAGAFLITDTRVDDFIRNGDQIIGVKTARTEGEVYCDTVILADGVNSLLSQKAGVRKKFMPSDFSVAAKEVLSLPKAVIEARFDLEDRQGLAHIFMGSFTRGAAGGGFLYTDKSNLSIGVVTHLRSLQEKKISIVDLLEAFKNTAPMKKALKGAILKEYAGHLIPEGGLHAMPKCYGDGILLAGDAAGFVVSTGITLRGMDFAIASGLLAAKAFEHARKKNDYSKKGLAFYKALLKKSFIIQDLKTYRRMPGFLSDPRVYDLYPHILCGLAKEIYSADGRPKERIARMLKKQVHGKISIWRFLHDMIKAGRSLI